MTRLVTAIRWDLRLQIRNGFYYATAFVMLLAIVILLQLRFTQDVLAVIFPIIILENIIINTFYFLAGIVLLEKGEGTLEGLVVSPLRKQEYLAAKLITLTLLSLLENLLLVSVVYGFGFNPFYLVMAITLMGLFFGLAGFIVVLRYESINAFLLPSVLVTTFFSIPLLDYLGVWQSWLVYLIPSQAHLALLTATFYTVEPWKIGYGLLYSIVWIGVAYWLAQRIFYQFVILKEGMHAGITGKAAHPTATHAKNKKGTMVTQKMRSGQLTLLGALKALGPIDARNIRRDSFLLWMAVMPFFFAAIFRFVLPWVREGILTQFNFDIAPYYILLMSYGFVIGTPVLFGVVIGFLLLDERDDKTLSALQTTPIPLNTYLAYRVSLPMVLSVVLTLIMFPMAGLVSFPIKHLLVVTLLSAPLAPIFALFYATFASNKVQGFAIMKGSGIFLILPLVAWFINSGWQLLFGIIPTYWPVKLYWVQEAGEPYAWIYFILGLAYQLIILNLLLRRFNKVMYR